MEPPPPDEPEGDESQLTHVDGDSAPMQNGVNGVTSQKNQIIMSGDTEAAKKSESKAIPPERRSTTPYMTKYEKARILGTRALQIR